MESKLGLVFSLIDWPQLASPGAEPLPPVVQRNVVRQSHRHQEQRMKGVRANYIGFVIPR